MKSRLVLVCGFMLVFLFGMWSGQPLVGQGKPVPATKVGKYQITSVGTGLFICDTETGLVWQRLGAGWQRVIEQKPN